MEIGGNSEDIEELSSPSRAEVVEVLDVEVGTDNSPGAWRRDLLVLVAVYHGQLRNLMLEFEFNDSEYDDCNLLGNQQARTYKLFWGWLRSHPAWPSFLDDPSVWRRAP
jgi:hypothetical protein